MENEHKHKFSSVILAAGQGTRMKSSLPKVMHKIASKPMIAQILATLKSLSPERVVLVVAPDMEKVADAAKEEIPACEVVIQDQQLGTGHAVAATEKALEGFSGTVLIVYGDTPLITASTLSRMLEAAESTELVVLGMKVADPTGYGRLVIDTHGQLEEIVECKDADAEQKTIGLCNAGVMAVKSKHLFDLTKKIGTNNSQGEHYLTDIVALADEAGLHSRVVEGDAGEVLGVNSRAQLAEAETALQARLRAKAMEQGATLIDPKTVYFSVDTQLGQDVVIHPHVVFGLGVRIADGVEIKSFSHLEGADVKENAIIGPFARLRPGAVIGEDAHVGNFVEIKKSTLGKGAKANHLSYIGDAEVGEGANIGAGTITCNYDGVEKHQTKIGANAFIGSNSSLVAPLTIGKGAVIGAGSVITEDVADDALALERGVQIARIGKAKDFKKKS